MGAGGAGGSWVESLSLHAAKSRAHNASWKIYFIGIVVRVQGLIFFQLATIEVEVSSSFFFAEAIVGDVG